MYTTRIAKLKGFKQILAGRDLGDVFKEGHVYGISSIAGNITFTDLGEHALIEKFELHKFSTIMLDGTYLLTKEEHKKQGEG